MSTNISRSSVKEAKKQDVLNKKDLMSAGSEGELHTPGFLAKVKAIMVSRRMGGSEKTVARAARDDNHDAKPPNQGTSFMRRAQTFKWNKKPPMQDEMDAIHIPIEENLSSKVSNHSDVSYKCRFLA
jgi:hypothetical protein